jgi:hypothetical protein
VNGTHQIRSFFLVLGPKAAMREVIGDRTVDELITIGRQDIEIEALARISAFARIRCHIRALAHRRSEDLFRAFAR